MLRDLGERSTVMSHAPPAASPRPVGIALVSTPAESEGAGGDSSSGSGGSSCALGTDAFWRELRAKVYQADVKDVNAYIAQSRATAVSKLASDIFNFQLGRSKFQLPHHEHEKMYQSCVTEVGSLMKRTGSTAELFRHNSAMISAMSHTWCEIAESVASPRTFGLTNNDGVYKLDALVSWYQLHHSLEAFQSRCEQMLLQSKEYRRAHCKDLVRHLLRLRETCRAQSDNFGQVGLPNHKQVPPVAMCLQVCNALAKETTEQRAVEVNRYTIGVLQMVLSLATQTNVPAWSDNISLHVGPESHLDDFRRELSQTFQFYVTMLLCVGGPARPEASTHIGSTALSTSSPSSSRPSWIAVWVRPSPSPPSAPPPSWRCTAAPTTRVRGC